MESFCDRTLGLVSGTLEYYRILEQSSTVEAEA